MRFRPNFIILSGLVRINGQLTQKGSGPGKSCRLQDDGRTLGFGADYIFVLYDCRAVRREYQFSSIHIFVSSGFIIKYHGDPHQEENPHGDWLRRQVSARCLIGSTP